MRKLLIVLTALCLFIPNIGVCAAENEYLWIESNQCVSSTGELKSYADENASGGNYVGINSKTLQKTSLTYSVPIARDGEYDIWIAASGNNVNYASKFKKSVDGSECRYSSYDSTDKVSSRATALWHDMVWTKAEQTYFEKGNHSFSITVDALRPKGDIMIFAFDCVVVVPHEWGFEPYKQSKPQNPETLGAEFAGGSVSEENIERETTVNVKVSNKLTHKIDSTPRIFAALMLNGSTVRKVVKSPEPEMNTWIPGKEYENEFSFDIPFDAPDGEYSIVTGIYTLPYGDGKTQKEIKTFTLGTGVKKEICNLKNCVYSLPKTQNKGEKTEGTISFEIDKKVDFDTTGYLTIWKRDELWGVIELGDIKTSLIEANKKTEIPISYIFSEDVPVGTYTLKFGIHKIKSDSVGTETDVSGETLDKTRIQKPMSNGIVNENKTGAAHFWYVNQSLAMIWDGKPYVPVGGMFCSRYLDFYDESKPEANKENFEHDKEVLNQMLSYGINDIYVNSVIAKKPVYAVQYLTDYLEENNIVYGLQYDSMFVGVDGSHTTHLKKESYVVRANDEKGICFKTDITDSTTASVKVTNFKSAVAATEIRDIGCSYIVIDDNDGGKPILAGTGSAVYNTAANEATFSADITVPENGAYTVVFTPKILEIGGQSTNMWDDPEWNIKLCSDFAAQWKPGENFRFFIDPVRNEAYYFNQDASLRYVADTYSDMYVKWLEDKYGTVEKLNKSWKLAPNAKSFAEAAEIIPAYTYPKSSANANTSVCFNRKTNELYTVDSRTGILWDDYIKFKGGVLAEFHNDVADAMSKYLDAPVVYKNSGKTDVCFVNTRKTGGFDGIGGECYGNEQRVKASMLYANSNAAQAAQTIWSLVTETNTTEDTHQKYNSGNWGYESREYMLRAFNGLAEAGAKGFFDFLFNCNQQYIEDAYGYIRRPERYGWLKEFKDGIIGGDKINSYADETIYKPAYIYPELPIWWWGTTARDCVLYEDEYTKGGQSGNKLAGFTCADTNNPDINADAIFANMSNAPASIVYGPALAQAIKNDTTGKWFVFGGLREDLGTIDVIDKYYTDEVVKISEYDTIQVLKPTKTSTVVARTSDGKPWAIIDGNLFIIANTNWRFKSDLIHSAIFSGNVNTDSIWIEAEKYDSLNGSYKKAVDSKFSGGSYVVLNSNENAEHTLSYNFTVKNKGKYDIFVLSSNPSASWLSSYALSTDEEEKTEFRGLKTDITSVDFTSRIQGTNQKMAWYKAASKEFEAGAHTLKITTSKSRNDGYKLNAFDAVAIVPSLMKWNPNGIEKPVAVDCTVINSSRYDNEEQVSFTPVVENENTVMKSDGNGDLIYNFEVSDSASYDIWITESKDSAEICVDDNGCEYDKEYGCDVTDFGAVSLKRKKLKPVYLAKGAHCITVSAPDTEYALGNIVIVPTSWEYEAGENFGETPKPRENKINVMTKEIVGSDGKSAGNVKKGDKLKGHLCVANNTKTDEKISCIIAEYDEGKLVGIEGKTVTAAKNNITDIVTKEIEALADDADIRLYAWNGAAPLEKPVFVPKTVIIEGEDYAEKSGGFAAANVSGASGGKLMHIPNSSEVSSLSYEFSVEQEAEYDIWLLSCIMNQNYISPLKWKVDNGDYAVNKNQITEKLYKYWTDMGWLNPGRVKLEAGKHRLTLLIDENRNIGGKYFAVDKLKIVPVSD